MYFLDLAEDYLVGATQCLPYLRISQGPHMILMDETKIKSVVLVSQRQYNRCDSSHTPLVSLISGGLQVVSPVSLRHVFPDLLPTCVSRFVVELGRDDEDDVICY